MDIPIYSYLVLFLYYEEGNDDNNTRYLVEDMGLLVTRCWTCPATKKMSTVGYGWMDGCLRMLQHRVCTFSLSVGKYTTMARPRNTHPTASGTFGSSVVAIHCRSITTSYPYLSSSILKYTGPYHIQHKNEYRISTAVRHAAHCPIINH